MSVKRPRAPIHGRRARRLRGGDQLQQPCDRLRQVDATNDRARLERVVRKRLDDPRARNRSDPALGPVPANVGDDADVADLRRLQQRRQSDADQRRQIGPGRLRRCCRWRDTARAAPPARARARSADRFASTAGSASRASASSYAFSAPSASPCCIEQIAKQRPVTAASDGIELVAPVAGVRSRSEPAPAARSMAASSRYRNALSGDAAIAFRYARMAASGCPLRAACLAAASSSCSAAKRQHLHASRDVGERRVEPRRAARNASTASAFLSVAMSDRPLPDQRRRVIRVGVGHAAELRQRALRVLARQRDVRGGRLRRVEAGLRLQSERHSPVRPRADRLPGGTATLAPAGVAAALPARSGGTDGCRKSGKLRRAPATGSGAVFGAHAEATAMSAARATRNERAHVREFYRAVASNQPSRRRGMSATIVMRPSRTSCSSTRPCR